MNKIRPCPICKNAELLASFTAYCAENPSQRFWQALRNWSGAHQILAAKFSIPGNVKMDTYYWESENG
jgi:hypothetical protein